jgi:hypothetical protein
VRTAYATQRALGLVRRRSLPPTPAPTLYEVPPRPCSVPPSDNQPQPHDAEGWALGLELLGIYVNKNVQTALELEKKADVQLKLAQEHALRAETYKRQALEHAQAAADLEQDQENIKTLARFVGVDLDRQSEPANFLMRRVGFFAQFVCEGTDMILVPCRTRH